MERALPRPSLIVFLAAAASVLDAASTIAGALRERSLAAAEQSHGAADGNDDLAARAGAQSLWPDPVGDADLLSRHAATCRGDLGTALLQATSAVADAPRNARVHLLAGALAREAGADACARREHALAARTDPFHGEVQLAAARDLLVDAVERQDDAELDVAARAFAAAVLVGALDCRDAYAALSSASAPDRALERVAGKDPTRLELLIEHHARLLEEEPALALARQLDERRADPSQAATALAERRLGAACFVFGRAEEAARYFDRAAERMAVPDQLALDRADAHLALGDVELGVELLVRALLSGNSDAARAAGSIAGSPDPERAARVLYARACAATDDKTRLLLADVFGALGHTGRRRELLVRASPAHG